MAAGILKRFARKPPPAMRNELRKFKSFVKMVVEELFVPLSPEHDLSFETWLELTQYPLWRKKELREVHEDLCQRYPRKGDGMIKSFMKDETYPSYKHARGINARVDAAKCLMGRFFKAIEDVVYKHMSFIKHVPVSDRAGYIYDMLYAEGATYLATDFETFEALFVEELMRSCEFVLYDHMTKFLPEHEMFLDMLEMMAGDNCCRYREFFVWLHATRMSGEMCTSLGNGFTNLMAFWYIAWKKTGQLYVPIVVEGDDGLSRWTYRAPPPTPDDYAELGMVIKLERHSSISTASFCGIVFDEKDLLNVTNPLEVLASFGWTTQRYARAKKTKLLSLLRCKALSAAHQYPGCPVVSALAQYGLRVTKGVDVRSIVESRAFNSWDRDQLRAAVRDERKIRCVDPPMRTRLLVEQLYGVSVADQLAVEDYLVHKDQISPICVNLSFSSDWVQYFDRYSMVVDRLSGSLEYPSGSWVVDDKKLVQLRDLLLRLSTDRDPPKR